ncbi:MAG: MFS transporter [Pseudomonadota bacterium]
MLPSTPPPDWRRPFALMVLGTFLACIAQFFLMPILPLLVVGPIGGDEGLVGIAVGMFAVTALLSRPVVGWLLDRFGRRVWLVGGMAICVPCMGAYGLVHSFPALVALRLVHGLLWGLTTVAMATVAADLVPAKHRGTGMGLFGLAMPMAMAVGPLIGTALLGEDRFFLAFSAGTAFSLGGLLAFLPVRIPEVRNPARLVLARMFEPRVLRMALFLAVFCVGFGGWMSFLPLYAPSLGLHGAGPLFFGYAIGGLTSRVFAGRWYDLAGPRGPGVLAVGLVVAGWLGFALAQHAGLAMAGAVLLGLGFGTNGTIVMAMAVDLVEPDRRGAATATVYSAYDIAIGGGAVLFGQFVDVAEVHRVFWAGGLASVLGGALFVLLVLPHFARNRLAV